MYSSLSRCNSRAPNLYSLREWRGKNSEMTTAGNPRISGKPRQCSGYELGRVRGEMHSRTRKEMWMLGWQWPAGGQQQSPSIVARKPTVDFSHSSQNRIQRAQATIQKELLKLCPVSVGIAQNARGQKRTIVKVRSPTHNAGCFRLIAFAFMLRLPWRGVVIGLQEREWSGGRGLGGLEEMRWEEALAPVLPRLF